MNVFGNVKTYIVSALVGFVAHYVAAHPGVIDPFYSGTLIGVILHALHMDNAAAGAAGTGTLPAGSA